MLLDIGSALLFGNGSKKHRGSCAHVCSGNVEVEPLLSLFVTPTVVAHEIVDQLFGIVDENGGKTATLNATDNRSRQSSTLRD